MSPDIVKGSYGGRTVPSEELLCYGVACDPAVPPPPFTLCQAYHHWEACSLANISIMPCSWGLGLSVLCYLALLVYLWWLAKFLSNSKVSISVWLQTLPPDLSHWLSYQGQSFPDSFSFLTYALTWFGSSLMVHEILKSKISQMKKLLLLRRHLFLPATSVAVRQVKAPSVFLKCTFVMTGPLLFRSLNVAKPEIHEFLLPLTDCNGLH